MHKLSENLKYSGALIIFKCHMLRKHLTVTVGENYFFKRGVKTNAYV